MKFRAGGETGTEWNDELSNAAAGSRVAIALYSPSYFTSVWCGREFQVFLDRRAKACASGDRAPVAIIPLIWIRHNMPPAASQIQYTDDLFPRDYADIGLRQIMALRDEAQYQRVRFTVSYWNAA